MLIEMEKEFNGYPIRYSFRIRLLEALKNIWFVKLWKWLWKRRTS